MPHLCWQEIAMLLTMLSGFRLWWMRRTELIPQGYTYAIRTFAGMICPHCDNADPSLLDFDSRTRWVHCNCCGRDFQVDRP